MKAQMHVLLWARMRNQTTADPKKSNQQLMQKCAYEHRNINAFLFIPLSEWEESEKGGRMLRTSSSGRATRMWDENGRDVMDKWDAHTQRREQGTKIAAPDKFSPEDLFLIRRTSLGWIPCSWSCARICQQGEKNYYSLPQAAYLWIITPLRRLTDMPGELKALSASSNSFCFLCYYSFYLLTLRKIWTS